MGELKPQSVAAPFGNADIAGTYVLGSGEPLVNDSTLSVGLISFAGVTVTGIEDTSFPSSLSGNNPLQGLYSVSGTTNNGNGSLTLTAPVDGNFSLWVTSRSEVLALEIDSSATQPVVLHLEQ